MNATLPDSAAAVCMVVYRALSTMTADFVDSWMDYLGRLDAGAVCLLTASVRRSTVRDGRDWQKFTSWAMANNTCSRQISTSIDTPGGRDHKLCETTK